MILLDLVVVPEGKPYQLGQLSDFIRKDSVDAETAEVKACHTAVVVYLHSRLVSPQVGILVEVPVGTGRPGLAFVIPVLTAERLPNGTQSIVIPDIFIRLDKCDRDIGLCKFIVGNLDGVLLLLETVAEILCLERNVIGIEQFVGQYLVASGRSIYYGIRLA